MGRYVALLRGINVGGRNQLAMAELRDAFEAGGYRAVRTYIQSGNVLFESEGPGEPAEEARIETLLERRFGLALVVVVRSAHQLRGVVDQAPDGFGRQPERYSSDVIFLKPSLPSEAAMRVVALRDGVDRAWPGVGVVYFERLSERRAESRMSRIIRTREYQQMTIRNWATTTKLLNLLGEPAATS